MKPGSHTQRNVDTRFSHVAPFRHTVGVSRHSFTSANQPEIGDEKYVVIDSLAIFFERKWQNELNREYFLNHFEKLPRRRFSIAKRTQTLMPSEFREIVSDA